MAWVSTTIRQTTPSRVVTRGGRHGSNRCSLLQDHITHVHACLCHVCYGGCRQSPGVVNLKVPTPDMLLDPKANPHSQVTC